MKVAVPVWQGRVSPVLDVAGQVLLVEWDQAGQPARSEQPLADDGSPDRRVALLIEWGVDTVICCAVSRSLELLMLAHGIKVISQVCGDVDDVLEAFQAGSLPSERFAMPGCRWGERGSRGMGRGRGVGRGRGMGRGRCRRGRNNGLD